MMPPNDIDHLKTMIVITQRRLTALQVQAARYGGDVPSHVTLEMEDAQAQLARLRAEYHALCPGAEPDPDLGRANWYLAHPYWATPHFTGRQTEQAMLSDWLAHDSPHPLLLLRALGGFGKSALTWHWLHAAVDPARWPRVVWWSLYETAATFETFLAETLAYLGHNPAHLPPRQQVETLLRELHQPGLLLVLDGFERALRAYGSLGAAYQGDSDAPAATDHHSGRECVSPLAEDFLRGVAARPRLPGRVLLTSRLRPTPLEARGGLLLQGCREAELTALHPADAVAYFQAHGLTGSRSELEQAGAPYGYHPLSLQLLAGYVQGHFDHPGDIRAAAALDLSGDLVQRRHHVLAQSYAQLTPAQRHLLGLIACFRGPVEILVLREVGADLPAPPLPTGGEAAPPPSGGRWGGGPIDATLHALLTRGLLHHDPATRRFDLHPIVRRYAYDRLAERPAAHARLRDYFAAIDPPQRVQRLEELAPLIELYHHTLRAGQHDAAWQLFYDRLEQPTYFQLGAYPLRIELLRGLFPDGEERPPRLSNERAQGWTLNALANSYSLNGQPGRAVPLLEMGNAIDEKRGDKKNLAIGLGNVACMAQIYIGALRAAETNLRRRIALCREIEDEFREAIGHQELGRLLAYCGAWPEAAAELDAALALFEKLGHVQAQGVTWAYRALAGLLEWRGFAPHPGPSPFDKLRAQPVGHVFNVTDPVFNVTDEPSRLKRDLLRAQPGGERESVASPPAGGTEGGSKLPPPDRLHPLAAARRALELAEGGDPNIGGAVLPRDLVRTYWLLGAAHRAAGDLAAAERPLTEALTRCRSINLVEFEADILLDVARLRAAQGDPAEGIRLAEEARLIAERSGYVLPGADANLFLARQALAAGAPAQARACAQRARELARCDGPPHYYKVAFDEAEALLKDEG